MGNSKIKDKMKKNGKEDILAFLKGHIRYFAAGALFLLLVLTLATCTEPVSSRRDDAVASGEGVEEFETDAHEDINTLIRQYYTAYAAGDLATLQMLATPISQNEQSYIGVYSQYVDEWQDIHCYTKTGLDAGSYLVSVATEIKFTGVDTPAPGLDFFYVRTNEAGMLYIDNLYSSYNANTEELAVDASVQALIDEYGIQPDVIQLQGEVQERYNEALLSDAALVTMIKTTLPDVINEWGLAVRQNAQTAVAETDTQQAEPTETTETTEQTTETQEQTSETTEQTTETLATTDRVNVRAGADTSAERLGTVDAGTLVTRVGVEGDWSVIEYNGGTGYIRNDYLTYDTSAAEGGEDDSDGGNDSDTGGDTDDGTVASFTEGTEIRLNDTVNVREGMSETADKVGTAYAGETVTVVMSYAEGWTKVKWNGKTDYIKSSLLE